MKRDEVSNKMGRFSIITLDIPDHGERKVAGYSLKKELDRLKSIRSTYQDEMVARLAIIIDEEIFFYVPDTLLSCSEEKIRNYVVDNL